MIALLAKENAFFSCAGAISCHFAQACVAAAAVVVGAAYKVIKLINENCH